MKKWNLIFIALLAFTGCKTSSKKESNSLDDKLAIKNQNTNIPPLFKNSIASTDIDFIKSTDPDAFLGLTYIGQDIKEMPGAESGELMDENTYIFETNFKDNKKIEIWAHSDFGNKEAAEIYVKNLTNKLGKLPSFMRNFLDHVVIHKGNSTAFAEDAGRFFVLYSDNMDVRIRNKDLEETVFHESIHVALDLTYAKNVSWKKAQDADGTFITEYAKSRPNKEDLAETAIFVYTMIKYPGRLSTDIEDWVKTNIPNRYAFLKEILN
jgi:hypothetical protein